MFLYKGQYLTLEQLINLIKSRVYYDNSSDKQKI